MKYKKRYLYIENVSAERLARKFDTPLYVYSYNKIKDNINNFKKNFKTINPLICFSVKSNSNLKILSLEFLEVKNKSKIPVVILSLSNF